MSAKPPQIIDVVAERLRRRTMQAPVVDAELHQYSNAYSLIGFAQYCSQKYRPSRVHHYIAAQLERVERGEIDRLKIEVPPRIGKTELSSRLFPAFCLGRNPSRQPRLRMTSAALSETPSSPTSTNWSFQT
jgi:hypothetical protein